jgi:transposase
VMIASRILCGWSSVSGRICSFVAGRRKIPWRSLEGRLQLFFLPSYSPELNPDEWVWKNIKHDQIRRQAIHRKGDFFELVLKSLENLKGRTATIQGFFRDPSLAYIAM